MNVRFQQPFDASTYAKLNGKSAKNNRAAQTSSGTASNHNGAITEMTEGGEVLDGDRMQASGNLPLQSCQAIQNLADNETAQRVPSQTTPTASNNQGSLHHIYMSWKWLTRKDNQTTF